MRTDGIRAKNISREREVSDPRSLALQKDSPSLQAGQNRKKNQIDRQDPQGAADVKTAQVDGAPLLMFAQQQPGDEKTADHKEKPHPQAAVKQPVKYRPQRGWKSAGKSAVKSQYDQNADGPPAIQ